MTRLVRLVAGTSVFAACCVTHGQTPAPAPTQPPQPQQTNPPPPPPAQVNGLTPPIQPQSPTAKVPPLIDVPPPPVPSKGIPNAPLTADEAARIALQLQPTVLIAAANVTNAKGQVVQQRAAMLPNIGLREGYSLTENVYTLTKNSSGQAQFVQSGLTGAVTLSQLVFDFNHTRDLVRASVANEKATEHSYTKAQIDAVLTVKQAYYTFVQNEGQVDVQQAAVDSAQAALDVAQAELNAGLGAPADVINAKTTLANDIQSLVEAKATMVQSRVMLCQDMGIDPRTPIVASSTATEAAESTLDMNSLVEQAIKVRPDVLAALETIRAAGFTVSAARTTNAPSLSVGLEAENFGTNDNILTNVILSPSVNLTWTFDDGGQTQGLVESAKAQAEIAKQTLKQTTLQVISDVSQAYVGVKTAEQRVDIANTQVELGQQNLKLAQGQYAAGVTPFVTVVTAEATLTQAKSDQVNAVANLAQSRATLRHAIGLGV